LRDLVMEVDRIFADAA